MNRKRRGLLRGGASACLALASGWTPGGAVRAQGALPATPPRAEPLVRQYMQEFAVPGFQLTYARGTRVLYTGCFGAADRETHQPVAPQSLFRIASNSKAFTSAAIFLLVEAGRLQLTDRVFAPGGVLQQFANDGAQREWLHAITVHELLTHTCGGWSNDGNDPMFQRPGLDHDQLIAWTLQTHRLQYAPGEKYAYSNFGYCLLGRVIEHVSGQPYAQFVRGQVLQRAQIRDMRIAGRNAAPGEVRYYGQGSENPYDIPIARMDSHGGWLATTQDQARFLACLFSPSDNEGATPILQAASLRTMTTGTRANPNYACGLEVNPEGNAFHSGSLPGTMSLMVHTKTGMAWAAVVNTRSPRQDAASRLDSMLWQIVQSVPQWRA